MDERQPIPPENENAPSDLESVVTTLESLQEETKANQEPQKAEIAGFWRRVAAFIIDGVFLAIPLAFLGLMFGEILYALGPYGRFIGYVFVVFPYMAYFNSEKKSGQTLGKRITKIAVVDKDSNYLSLGKSLARAFIISLIALLNGWVVPQLQSPIIVFITTVIAFGGSLAIIYAFIFNRTTRQGLHDLIVGSYVVKAPPNPAIPIPEMPKIHRRIMYGLIGVVFLFSLFGLLFQREQDISSPLLAEGEWQELVELQDILMETGEFYTVGVFRQNRRRIGSQTELRDLNIDLWAKKTCRGNPDYCDETVDWAARIAFEYFEGIENLSGMKVTVVNRYELAYLSSSRAQGIAWSIEDWQANLTN